MSSWGPHPLPPQATEGTAEIIGVSWQPAAGGGHRSTSLPASRAGLGPPEPVWLVWRLLLPELPGREGGGEGWAGMGGGGWGMGSRGER